MPIEKTCVVNGFVFRPLRNTGECARVGKELKNCLGSWESFNSTIVAVSNNDATVGAIAVWGHSISQAHAYDNNSIESVPGDVQFWDRFSPEAFFREETMLYYFENIERLIGYPHFLIDQEYGSALLQIKEMT